MAAHNSHNYNGTAAEPVTVDNDVAREALLGTEHRGRDSNISWGSIIAGVITFLAVTVLLSLVTAGIGLGGAGLGAGIWSIIALAIALFAAGFVSGALSLRSGVFHGFLTWATSLVVALALTVLLGASVLGAVGGVVNSVTQAVSGTDVTQVVQDTADNVDKNEVKDQTDQTIKDAQDTAKDVAANAQAGSWYGFVGLLIGALISAAGGAFGVRSVLKRNRDNEAVVTRTTR